MIVNEKNESMEWVWIGNKGRKYDKGKGKCEGNHKSQRDTSRESEREKNRR